MTNWIYDTPNYMNARRSKTLIWIYIALAVGVTGVLIAFFMGFFGKLDPLYLTIFFWIINVVILIWLGNRGIAKWLDRRYPWNDFVSRRFFVQLGLSTIYSLSIVNLTFYLYRQLFTQSTPDLDQFAVMNIYGLLFVLPAVSINFGIYFLQQWKKSKLRAEQLEKERIRSQLESLKSHLDPHFLFNNLNILGGLIGQDDNRAQKFLTSFSDVYRYVLKNKNEELVPLGEEMKFLDSYIQLLRMRFKDAMLINKDPQLEEGNYYVLPMALQILLENVIKHNYLTEEEPLDLEIRIDGESIVVQNSIQKKDSSATSIGTGLENIRKRLSYLTDQQLEVMNIDSHFIVKLPLLKVD